MELLGESSGCKSNDIFILHYDFSGNKLTNKETFFYENLLLNKNKLLIW